MRRGWEVPNFAVDGQQEEDDSTPQTSREGGSLYTGLGQCLEPFVFLEDTDNPEDMERTLQQATIHFYRQIFQHDATSAVRKVDLPPTDFCRICRDTDSKEHYISPCNCKGTLALVHRSCLERWLAESDTSFCELCGFQYTTVRIPRYGVVQSLAMWATQTSHRDLVFDAIAFGAFMPLALMGTYLGLSAGRSYYNHDLVEARLHGLPSQAVTLGLVGFMAAIDFSCSAWLVMRVQYHATQWYSWWRRNCTVRLQLSAKQDKAVAPR